jgi:hypothetical protein
LGFRNYFTDSQNNYVGALHNKKVMIDNSEDKEKSVKIEKTILDVVANVCIAVIEKRVAESSVKIEISGKDYTVDEKGTNIVIYDARKKELIDSVTVDRYGSDDIKCYRISDKKSHNP